VSGRAPHIRSAVAAAHAARERTGVPVGEPLPDVLAAVETLGVEVLIASLPGLAGAYVRRGDIHLALVSAEDPPVRRRFTLAHELGHHELHGTAAIDTAASLRDFGFDPVEAGANWFAAEFLAPEPAVLACVEALEDDRPNLEMVVRVASRFAVSAKAARIRLETAGVIGERATLERLDREIDEGLHLELVAQLGLETRHDGCSAAGDALPRLPDRARGTALEDLARGRWDAAAVAALLGCSDGAARAAHEAVLPG
jgi:Zn-dependent peptidase ImmA (M78 family)